MKLVNKLFNNIFTSVNIWDLMKFEINNQMEPGLIHDVDVDRNIENASTQL